MSGGVDSSLAAALLKEKGYPVIGITMLVRTEDGADLPDFVNDARRVADALGIPHYMIDLREIFQDKVITPFCQEYATGRTPNPCVRCNRYIKFDALFARARALGARYIATGHHARITRDGSSGRMLILKGMDRQKDQSYFLYALTQEQLGHAMFPIGHLTKTVVRETAGEKGLPVARRPESQDICFLKDCEYAEFLRDFIPQAAQSGPIQDEQGDVIGRHQGILNYTIGQRKGLSVVVGEPRYVIAIDPENNTVIVGRRESAFDDELIASQMNWGAIDRPTESITARARIRYHHAEANAIVTPVDNDSVYVKFLEPQLAITPGQAIVFYDGDKVLGGGTIKSSGKSAALKQMKEFAGNG
jgi:tRNA-specific 2-thiouridylase